MAFLADYALMDILKISCTGYDGKHAATIRQIKKGNLKNGNDTVWATGMNEAKLAGFSTNKAATFTATSGLVSDGGFVLNGAKVIVSNSGTGYLYEEVIKLAGATSAVLKHKASGTAGSEIGYIYGCDMNGNIDSTKEYAQDTTASATKFSYAAATKTITLPTDVFTAGQYILVKYLPTFSTIKKIYRDSASEPFEGEIRIFCLVKKLCGDDNGNIDLGQIYLPRGRFDGNFDTAFGDAAAVQDFTVEALLGCGVTGNFWEFYVASEDDIVDT